MLTEGKIQAMVTQNSTFTKGISYFHEGRVRQLRFSFDKRMFTAQVRGEQVYEVAIEFDRHQEMHDCQCTCPAFAAYDGACKHIVAVLKAIQAGWAHYFSKSSSVFAAVSPAQQLLEHFRRESSERIETAFGADQAVATVKVIPHLAIQGSVSGKKALLQLSMGHDRLYIVKNLLPCLQSLLQTEEFLVGKSLTIRSLMDFELKSRRIVEFLLNLYREEMQRSAWQYGSSLSAVFAEARFCHFTDFQLRRFLELQVGETLFVSLNRQNEQSVTVTSGRPPIAFVVEPTASGLRLAWQSATEIIEKLDQNGEILYYNHAIYLVDQEFAKILSPVLDSFSRSRQSEVAIDRIDFSEFFGILAPTLQSVATVNVSPQLVKQIERLPLAKLVSLDRYGQGMSASVLFQYGDYVCNPLTETFPVKLPDGRLLIRNFVAEQNLLGFFAKQKFNAQEGLFVLSDEGETYSFLQRGLAILLQMAQVSFSQEFQTMELKPTQFGATVRLNQTTDLLEFSFDYGNFSASEMASLLAAYKLKRSYHRLPDGAFISLEDASFQTVAELISELGLRQSDVMRPLTKLSKYWALYLDEFQENHPDFALKKDELLTEMTAQLQRKSVAAYSIPDGVSGTLRDYQKKGFSWLMALADYGLGGILADDMGLGKTLQVLTFLLARRQASPYPSLVVAPTSLLYNWQEEAAKFTPDLRVKVIAGAKMEREELLLSSETADLLITSYGLLKRDIELYSKKKFYYCILDEAQNIKNPQALNSKAAKKIQASSYFALTGTPIENRLTELWSIFDFLMPGYLGTYKKFASRFEIPLQQQRDQKIGEQLRRKIKPFILRRMKETVLPELPPKLESRLLCQMTSEQEKVYATWLVAARQGIEAELSSQGLAKSHMRILALLTRLRQIACHPSLFLENYQGGSGKIRLLKELLQEALSSGHRVLVFSQFTALLHLLKAELEALGIEYFYLDGATKAAERLSLTEAFNQGEKEVFLISLKAGGTGLNLTGADMVIHCDPWWNPAVEDQATDRAYRIGQQRFVQVYKLITQNTIEEKIFQLQLKKKEMVSDVLAVGETFLGKLTEDELRELFS
ncbi:MAG: DEAD/DEAH box helicase [Sporomusaceae bacterium]|nr:DEAD/DEAH box helicase [Sporomusaceae bacterium]